MKLSRLELKLEYNPITRTSHIMMKAIPAIRCFEWREFISEGYPGPQMPNEFATQQLVKLMVEYEKSIREELVEREEILGRPVEFEE